MQFFRQYIAPLIAVVIFALALVIVSARIFLPEDLSQPGPGSQLSPVAAEQLTLLPPGLPPGPAMVTTPH